MGACFSKKSTTTPTAKSTASTIPNPQEVKVKPTADQPEKKETADVAIVAAAVEQELPMKEFVVIKHRKSHEVDKSSDQESSKEKSPTPGAVAGVSQSTTAAAAVAAVSNGECGKTGGAQVRTSSCSKEEVDAILIQCGRLSRSSSAGKAETPSRGRRYSGSKRSFDFDSEVGSKNEDEGAAAVDGVDHHHHHRHRQREPRVSSPSSSRRRSRERENQQQRSGSKERATGNGTGRRVSRSPNRRSESPIPNSSGGGGGGGGGNKPGKMVSVPATEKNNNGGGGEVAPAVGGGTKRIQVKRNVGENAAAVGARTTASPRSRSPARANFRVLNENPPLSLSRSNSRKAEHSPYRRNPLADIDNNVGLDQSGNKKPNGEKMTKNCMAKEHQVPPEEAKLNQAVARSRSSRLSRDLDINPESLLNPNPPSYASLLLEDIQNFHQKNPPGFSIPACVSKACSIMEAVADLNSAAAAATTATHKRDSLVEVVGDDLMEPSLHKYVTVKRGVDAADNEEQESSGSNSFAGSQQLSWLSSSWEPNSADSTNCLTSSSRSNEAERNGGEAGKYPRNGIGRGGRSAYSMP